MYRIFKIQDGRKLYYSPYGWTIDPEKALVSPTWRGIKALVNLQIKRPNPGSHVGFEWNGELCYVENF